MIYIAICICTRRRPKGLQTLLKSIDELIISSKVELKVIIVENDDQSFSKKIVDLVSDTSSIMMSYFLEQRQGISYARNRAVHEAGDVDFCCFVDDDQQVDSNWLVELLKCQVQYDCSGVWGPNPPRFNRDVSACVRKFHEPMYYEYGELVAQAATNCLLIRKSCLDELEGPFDIRLNFSGGEDSLLTRQIIAKGGEIRFTPFAKAFEIVPDSRSTERYVVRRTIRIANTQLIVKSIEGVKIPKVSIMFKSIIRFIRGILITIPYYIIGGENKLKGIFKMSYSYGVFMFFLGKKNNFYQR